MSGYKSYNAMIQTSFGKGEEVINAVVNVRDILPTGLTGEDALKMFVEKYGADRAIDLLLTQGWKVAIQKIGHSILKEGKKGHEEETIEEAVKAMKNFAHGDMAPKARVVKVKMTHNEIVAKLEADGINTSSPAAQKIINAISS